MNDTEGSQTPGHCRVPPAVELTTEVLPAVLHTYQNHTLDSTLWQHFSPRDDDIVVATAYKSGTTWVQAILAHLILGTDTIPTIDALSPWIDMRHAALGDTLERLDAQQHRRFVKSHLPLDGLPFYRRVKYVVVGRDPRDVFMSMWNHYASFTDAFLHQFNDAPGRVGPPLAPAPPDMHAFWRDWISRGWFAWEQEGYPFWGNLHHTNTWWQYRHLDNILLVHFNDLLTDLSGEIRRIARFLDIDCAEEHLAAVAGAVTFATMKQQATQLLPGAESVWRGGAQTFIFRGTNGRWRTVLSENEVAQYSETVARVLEPECATWLEHGRLPHA